jgi:hypothetical protein
VSVPEALSIRLRTGTSAAPIRDVHITSEVDDLVFGATSPGGYSDCTMTLHRPLKFTPAEIAQFGRVYIYDARNRSTVWEGRLQDPGRSAGTDGEVYQLAAVGGVAHLQDVTQQYYAIDTDPGHWDQIDVATPAAQVNAIADTGATGGGSETPALSLRIPYQTPVDGAVPSRVVAAHRGFAAAGQKIGGIQFDWDTGLTAATLVISCYAATDGVGAADVAFTTTFNTAGGTGVNRVVDPGAGSSAWSNGRNKPIFRFHYTGSAGNVSADTWWAQFANFSVRAMLFNKSGTELTTGYGSPWVLASDIVEDTLGRMLGATVDGANATVAATSYQIEQLAYPDGVSPQKIFEDLIGFEQAYTYHLWESNPANDKFRFEWIPWPTVVRYETDVIDGFDAPASGNTVYNQVAVRWHNRGTIRVSLRTQTVPMLDAAGLTRTAFLDLGDEASTANNAHQVGDQFLSEHQYPVNAGRLVVKRPMIDIETGRMVQPWEIRPGELIRVRGVTGFPDSLNNTGRNGVTVFKIAATSYSSADNACTLDLDVYAPSVARALAAWVRKPPQRRR